MLGRGGIASPVIWKLTGDCGENKASLAGCAAVLHGCYALGAGLVGACARARAFLTREGIGPNRSYRVWDAGRGRTVGITGEYLLGRKNYGCLFARQESLRLPII
jgi:hypothetical protein